MNIRGTNYEIVNSNGKVYSNISGYMAETPFDDSIHIIAIKSIAKNKTYSDAEVRSKVYAYAKAHREVFKKEPFKNIHNTLNAKGPEYIIATQRPSEAIEWAENESTKVEETVEETIVEEVKEAPKKVTTAKYKAEDKITIIDIITRLRNFFTEFEFEPSDRFVDTVFRIGDADEIKKHIINYFKLTDNMNLGIILEKVKCEEFTNICNDVASMKDVWVMAKPEPVNTRFEVRFGPAGTGKSTSVARDFPDAECLLCSEDLHPDELQKEFDFNDENGFPVWKMAPILRAAVNGKPIICDEFGLIPTGGQRFLQGLTDGKEEVTTPLGTIKIKPGFKIVATMNLYEGGMTYRLSEPLVDRAYKLTEMKVTPEITIAHLWGDAEEVM